jgi:hypothetical protein
MRILYSNRCQSLSTASNTTPAFATPTQGHRCHNNTTNTAANWLQLQDVAPVIHKCGCAATEHCPLLVASQHCSICNTDATPLHASTHRTIANLIVPSLDTRQSRGDLHGSWTQIGPCKSKPHMLTRLAFKYRYILYMQYGCCPQTKVSWSGTMHSRQHHKLDAV